MHRDLPEEMFLKTVRVCKEKISADAGEGLDDSPFAHSVALGHDEVGDVDVEGLQRDPRAALDERLKMVRKDGRSQLALVYGPAGMGKTHLLRVYDDPRRMKQQGYVFLHRDNLWQLNEFAESLLNTLLDALYKDVDEQGNDLLLRKVQSIAFRVLDECSTDKLSMLRAAKLSNESGMGTWWRWWRSTPTQPPSAAELEQLVDQLDPKVFRWLDGGRFADHVCNRCLQRKGDPAHRYVVRVLLLYLFEEQRNNVRDWLRRSGTVHFDSFPSGQHMTSRDTLDREFELFDVVKILFSLFAPDRTVERDDLGRTFFLCYDQFEFRSETFSKSTATHSESEDFFNDDPSWREFFARLSELYNNLPNVLIVFSMTQETYQRLLGLMELQFKQRLQMDQRLLLVPEKIADDDIADLYEVRIRHWLGDGKGLGNDIIPFAPFSNRGEVGGFRLESTGETTKARTIREVMQVWHQAFKAKLLATPTDPALDYHGFVASHRNRAAELKRGSGDALAFYRQHLHTANELLKDPRSWLLEGMSDTEADIKFVSVPASTKTQKGRPALFLNLLRPKQSGCWVRVYYVLLGRWYTVAEDYQSLIKKHSSTRNFLWFVRPEAMDPTKVIVDQYTDQIRAELLSEDDEITLGACLDLMRKTLPSYDLAGQTEAKKLLLAQFRGTVLGRAFQFALDALKKLDAVATPSMEPDEQPSLVEIPGDAAAALDLEN